MPGTLAEMLGGALAPPQQALPTANDAPLLNADRSRFPPGILEALGLGGGAAPAGAEGYFDDPLLNQDRSRFPAGMLEALGLGAARR